MHAHSAVTNAGRTRVTGNVGVSPGEVVSGLPSDAFSAGNIHRDDALARQARVDANAVEDALASRPCTRLDSPSLGGQTLPSGVYCLDAADVELNGTLFLDAEGNRDAVWIFRMAGKLTTASDASVLVVGNGYDGNVFWLVDSASLGARTTFIGNLFARTDIVLESGASLSGRLFSRTGTVALNANDVSLCCAPITLAPEILPDDGTLGMPYRATLTASGGLAPYTFTVTSGSLPAGVELASNGMNGILQGAPETFGPFTFTITATDARGCRGTAKYDIRIECGTRTPLPAAVPGEDYAVALGLEGTCVRSDGELPPGVFLDGCSLAGKPTTVGTFEFVVDSTDAMGVRRSRCFRVDVAPCPIRFVSPAPPDGAMCELYKHVFEAEGGVEPYTFTAPVAALPPGLTLDPDGPLVGSPSVLGPYSVPVTVTDTLLRSCTTTYTITVACPSGVGEPIALPRGFVAKPYSHALPAPACGGPWSFSFVSGTLPPGLSPPTPDGTMAGTPMEEGTYRFVVARTDGECVVMHDVTIDIGGGDPPDPDCTLLTVVEPDALPNATATVPYAEIVVTGGTAPYVFDVTSGSLPPGLELFSDGKLSGTPSAAGTYAFNLLVVDSNGCSATVRYCAFDVAASGCPSGTSLELSPRRLPPAIPDEPYAQPLTAAGGSAPYTFIRTSGALPPGLTLGPMTGLISGMPTVAGSYTFTVTVIDANGCRASLCYRLPVTTVIPALSVWALCLVSILLAVAGWIALGRR